MDIFKKTPLKALLCFAAGGFSSLAMAPASLWPALFVGLSTLYIALVKAHATKTAFLYGWLFGFGYFLFGLSWIGNALLIEGNPYKWAWPLAVSGLPFILSFFTASACALSKHFSDLKKISGFLSFCSLMIIFEWLRGHVFTGFPWNLFGYTWGEILPLIQVVSLSDIYLLSFLTVLWATLPGYLYISVKDKDKMKQALILALLILSSFIATYGYGSWRLNNASLEYHEDIEIRIVQPNIEQKDKWDRAKMMSNFQKLLDLSRPDSHSNKTTYIIWPETALSQWFLQDKISREQISMLLTSYENSAILITGALRNDLEKEEYFNSLIIMNTNGEITNIYNKHHLVPFGEYIPFQKWIPLTPVVNFTGFVKGNGPQTYKTPEGLSYLPLICYEAIFPGKAQKENLSPDFIINITNDAWYGKSAGPYQHFMQNKFRALETGTPLVRSANTGISALIDPYGRVTGISGLFETSSNTMKLPKKN